MKCQGPSVPLRPQPTRDSGSGGRQLAAFPGGCTGRKCCDECDDFKVYDAEGNHFATIHNGSQYRYVTDPHYFGIFDPGKKTGDAQKGSVSLEAINRKNAEFWRSRT